MVLRRCNILNLLQDLHNSIYSLEKEEGRLEYFMETFLPLQERGFKDAEELVVFSISSNIQVEFFMVPIMQRQIIFELDLFEKS